VKIALAQINPTIGDFTGNIEKILDYTRRANDGGADLVLFPELAVCGYPPADFLDKPSFIKRSEEAIAEIAAATAELSIASIVGYVTPAHAATGKRVMNSAAFIHEGKVEFVQS
jgi:NAD+ synthase (glutamine-hydrolysing)